MYCILVQVLTTIICFIPQSMSIFAVFSRCSSVKNKFIEPMMAVCLLIKRSICATKTGHQLYVPWVVVRRTLTYFAVCYLTINHFNDKYLVLPNYVAPAKCKHRSTCKVMFQQQIFVSVQLCCDVNC